jgi:hypothetical protein
MDSHPARRRRAYLPSYPVAEERTICCFLKGARLAHQRPTSPAAAGVIVAAGAMDVRAASRAARTFVSVPFAGAVFATMGGSTVVDTCRRDSGANEPATAFGMSVGSRDISSQPVGNPSLSVMRFDSASSIRFWPCNDEPYWTGSFLTNVIAQLPCIERQSAFVPVAWSNSQAHP